jgi:hypothetical protein
MRSAITGVPLGFAVGLPTLLQALAALVIGRLEHLPTIVATASVLGLLESGVQWNSESPYAAYPIMAAVMFAVLLVQRPGTTRRDNDATSSWRGAEEVRPLDAAALADPWINTMRSPSSASRSWCSPAGPGRSRSVRWESSRSARPRARRAPIGGTSTCRSG